jgi:hypothetical protein
MGKFEDHSNESKERDWEKGENGIFTLKFEYKNKILNPKWKDFVWTQWILLQVIYIKLNLKLWNLKYRGISVQLNSGSVK